MDDRFTYAAKSILQKRCLRDGESIEEMFRRVAVAIAEAEETPELKRKYAEEFYELMTQLDFLPNSPTLMNAGKELGQLAACFVLPVRDSMHDIFSGILEMAMVQKSGGGTGFNFSKLRPQGAPVSSTYGVASGPISFMKVFDAATETIKQGGTRRGANMGSMIIHHPDIEDFITCKDVEGSMPNFNISVVLTDEFMDAVRLDRNITLRWNDVSYKEVSARALMQLLTRQAWRNGEPGILFGDVIEKGNTTPHLGQLEGVNPCGEQPLLDHESCILGSINLANMVSNRKVDWKRLMKVVMLSVRLLDNVITINKYPLEHIEKATLRTRKIGLGVMGWADMLIELGIPYDSSQALELAESVMKFIQEGAQEQSLLLGEKKGVYPAYVSGPRYRNAAHTTIAPTGTLATIAGVSYGIEPLFGLSYRKRMIDKDFIEINEAFMRDIQSICSPEHVEAIKDAVTKSGSCQHLTSVPSEIKALYKTAAEISYKAHIRMQAAFQKYVDNAVSKTINMPHNANPGDIEDAILYAYKRNCKGLTFYRAGARKIEAVSVGTNADVPSTTEKSPKRIWGSIKPLVRPRRLGGITASKRTALGKMYLTLNMHEGHPFELFAQIGKAGSDVAAFTEAVARLVSLALRSGINPDVVAKELLDIGGSKSVGFGNERVRSVPDGIGQFIMQELQGDSCTEEAIEVRSSITSLCPSCGIALASSNGCIKCDNCGYNEC